MRVAMAFSRLPNGPPTNQASRPFLRYARCLRALAPALGGGHPIQEKVYGRSAHTTPVAGILHKREVILEPGRDSV